jgi:hypothetical protein
MTETQQPQSKCCTITQNCVMIHILIFAFLTIFLLTSIIEYLSKNYLVGTLFGIISSMSIFLYIYIGRYIIIQCVHYYKQIKQENVYLLTYNITTMIIPNENV